MPEVVVPEGTCVIWRCGRPAKMRGYCGACYMQIWRGEFYVKQVRVRAHDRKDGTHVRTYRRNYLKKRKLGAAFKPYRPAGIYSESCIGEEGCAGKVLARGMCNKHYLCWYRSQEAA